MRLLDDAEVLELELPADAWPGFETVRDSATYVLRYTDTGRLRWLEIP